jgi:hypothetical protein
LVIVPSTASHVQGVPTFWSFSIRSRFQSLRNASAHPDVHLWIEPLAYGGPGAEVSRKRPPLDAGNGRSGPPCLRWGSAGAAA